MNPGEITMSWPIILKRVSFLDSSMNSILGHLTTPLCFQGLPITNVQGIFQFLVLKFLAVISIAEVVSV